MTERISSVAIRTENDVVLGRQRAKQIAALLGFDAQDQTRIATAVSELARNAYQYAGGGRIEFRIEGRALPQSLAIAVSDEGPGIADVEHVLSGNYRSPTGMGVGLVGAQRLMDGFAVRSEPGRGTTVTLVKHMARQRRLLRGEDVAAIATELARTRPPEPIHEIQVQNQELLRALDDVSRRQQDLDALNHELEDTNRGVVALYAELEERAEHLRRADDLKSRFLSNMSHEFRTPVNSIQALSRMLLDRLDGDLTPEQERQVGFIRKAADELSELVNDLLDLAKVEAGKVVVRPAPFEVANLFGALRGMMRPLLMNDGVSLVFEEPRGIPTLCTDEAKVSQILRNFVSNALKFTEAGEVRIRARQLDAVTVEFAVSDTGMGIAGDDLERIFQEFGQVENPVQKRVKGTGLGLPLCRKLAELLGGTVRVASTPGKGSTFAAAVPLSYVSPASEQTAGWIPDADRLPLLVVADPAEGDGIADALGGTRYQVYEALSVREARDVLSTVAPRAIIFDAPPARADDGWLFLTEVKRRPETARIPVLMATGADEVAKSIALGADACVARPADREALLGELDRLLSTSGARKILVVDDEEISRYLLCQNLSRTPHRIIEATGGPDGLRLARQEHPDLICLDLTMPELDGYELLRTLKSDPTTRPIPVVIVTSRALEKETHGRLLESAAAVLSKERVAELPATVERALRAGAAS